MMRKKPTTHIREEIYESLISRGLFPEEKKEFLKRPREMVELLFIDQHILKDERNSYGVDWQKRHMIWSLKARW